MRRRSCRSRRRPGGRRPAPRRPHPRLRPPGRFAGAQAVHLPRVIRRDHLQHRGVGGLLVAGTPRRFGDTCTECLAGVECPERGVAEYSLAKDPVAERPRDRRIKAVLRGDNASTDSSSVVEALRAGTQPCPGPSRSPRRGRRSNARSKSVPARESPRESAASIASSSAEICGSVSSSGMQLGGVPNGSRSMTTPYPGGRPDDPIAGRPLPNA